MQKIAKNAYILIWSIFLSLSLWFIFLNISNWVTKNLKQNIKIKDSINLSKIKENNIKEAVINNDFSNINLTNNQVLIFEKSNNIFLWLKENEEITLRLYWEQNMTISINNWSPIEYRNTTTLSINWTIYSIETFNTWDWELIIKNLWWYSNIRISSEWNFNTPYKSYQIIQRIWNKNIIKENNKIKIF